MMDTKDLLIELYHPIKKELMQVEDMLKVCLQKIGNAAISEMGMYLLDAHRKRLRPACTLLSARASKSGLPRHDTMLISVATAIELIHLASLVHDDVIDHAVIRHFKATVNARWNNDLSVALGDYLYCEASHIIAECGRNDIIQAVAAVTKTMCEGELLQICERGNTDLSIDTYYAIIQKKTASLFAASCKIGALLADASPALQKALEDYGTNFGSAFQIIDDYRDIIDLSLIHI